MAELVWLKLSKNIQLASRHLAWKLSIQAAKIQQSYKQVKMSSNWKCWATLVSHITSPAYLCMCLYAHTRSHTHTHTKSLYSVDQASDAHRDAEITGRGHCRQNHSLLYVTMCTFQNVEENL